MPGGTIRPRGFLGVISYAGVFPPTGLSEASIYFGLSRGRFPTKSELGLLVPVSSHSVPIVCLATPDTGTPLDFAAEMSLLQLSP